mgnify:CR=1 FL=1
MVKVKIFLDTDPVKLEDTINKWLAEHSGLEVLSVSNDSTMLVLFYREARKKYWGDPL